MLMFWSSRKWFTGNTASLLDYQQIQIRIYQTMFLVNPDLDLPTRICLVNPDLDLPNNDSLVNPDSDLPRTLLGKYGSGFTRNTFCGKSGSGITNTGFLVNRLICWFVLVSFGIVLDFLVWV